MKKAVQIFKKITWMMLGVFGFVASGKSQCNVGETEVFIDVITDAYGYEVYWELTPQGAGCGTPSTIFSGGNTAVGCAGGGLQAQAPGGYANNTTVTEGGFCLVIGNTYDIIAVDDWGDGGTCFSSVAQGFNFCMPGTSSNNTFSFTVINPITSDLAVTSFSHQYTRIPLPQAQQVNLGATVNNLVSTDDSATLTANVYLGASLQQTSNSATTFISGSGSAVLTAGTFTPLSLGDYTVEYIVVSVNGDGNSSNDTLRYMFEITPNVYARDNDVATGSLGIGAGASANGILGQNFEVFNNAEMDSVLVFIANGGGNTMVGQPLSVGIYSTTSNEPATLIGSTDTIIVSTTGPHWVSLPVQSGLILAPGVYYFGVREADSNLTVGTTNSIFTTGSCWVNWNTNPLPSAPWSNNEEFGFNVTYLIRAAMSDPTATGFDINNRDESVIVYPNPAHENFNVLFNLNGNKEAAVEISDINGKIIFSRNYGKIESKAQINISIPGYAPGLYFVKISTGTEAVYKKVILK